MGNMKNNLKQIATKKHIIFLLVLIVIFIFFVLFAYLSPYSGDDWAWGSSEGLERLYSFFDGYNGRYAGNLLIILITRFKFFDILIKAVCFSAVCLLPCCWTKTKKVSVLLLSFLLFLFMPTDVLSQSVIWSSGFSNYVPSALLCVFLVYILSKPLYDKELKSTPVFYIFISILSFLSTLFIENITVFMIIVLITFIIISKIKFKKVKVYYWCAFFPALAGAVLMFSNSAYLTVFSGNDGYRSVSSSIGDLIMTCGKHVIQMIDIMLITKPVFIIIITVLTAVLCFCKFSSKKIIDLIISAVNIISGCLIVLYSLFNEKIAFLGTNILIILRIGCVCVWILSLIIIIFKAIKIKEDLWKLLIPLLGALFVSIPLLPVEPFGARCMFCTYAFLICFTAVLFKNVLNNIDIKKFTNISVSVILAVICIAGSVNLGSIMFDINNVYTERTNFAKIQSNENKSVIYICELPHPEYIWMDIPENDLYEKRYKDFYKLNENASLKIIDYSQLSVEFETFKQKTKQNY